MLNNTKNLFLICFTFLLGFLYLLLTNDSFIHMIKPYLEDDFITLEYYFRIFLSACVGAVIGLDRARRSKPLGFKTYTLLCMGATLITIISILSVHYFTVKGVTMMDPMRLVAQLLPAVGFVGAGSIYFSNNKVKGLTSAAFVFFTCTVGVGIGAGFYGLTLFTMIIAFVFLTVEQKLEFKYFGKDHEDE